MKVSRRSLVFRYGPLGALLLAPVLRTRRGRAQTGERIKRFVTFFSSSGVRQDIFWPSGSAGDSRSGRYSVDGTSLAPLAPFLDDVIIPKGIEINRGPGDAHNAGSGAILTGNYLRSEDVNNTPFVDGPSLDHFLGGRLGAATPERSLLLGVRLQINRVSKFISFDDRGFPNQYIQDPYQVYTRAFAPLIAARCGMASSGGQSEAAARHRLRRSSVLDLLRRQTGNLSVRAGLNADERQKLERMEDSIRSVERRIAAAGPTMPTGGSSSGLCESLVEEIESGPRVENTDSRFPDLLRLQMDLTALALELDITRVVTLSLSLGGSGGAPMRWLRWNDRGTMRTIEASHHNISHGTQRGVENYREKLEVVDRWNFEQLAYLLGRLKGTFEGEHDLLSNSLVWYASDCGEGKAHTKSDAPFIIAGSAAGAIDTGRYIQLSDRPAHQRLLVDFARAMGQGDVTSWGRGTSGGSVI